MKIGFCKACGSEFIIIHSRQEYCENPECKKECNRLRQQKYYSINKEYVNTVRREKYKGVS